METSPRRWRICDVRGATTTSDRASSSLGAKSTKTGRPLAARPRSAYQTSPACGLVLTEGLRPLLGLLLGTHQGLMVKSDLKGKTSPPLNLCKEHIHGIRWLEPEMIQNFFHPPHTVYRDAGTQQGRCHTHVLKVLGNAHFVNFGARTLPNSRLMRALRNSPIPFIPLIPVNASLRANPFPYRGRQLKFSRRFARALSS